MFRLRVKVSKRLADTECLNFPSFLFLSYSSLFICVLFHDLSFYNSD